MSRFGPLSRRLVARLRILLTTWLVAAGATAIKPVQNQFYGDRSGTVTDPFGHAWTISTHVEDVAYDEVGRRSEAFLKQHALG